MKIIIPKPCHENWDEMTTVEQGRFCSVCTKVVRDFTNFSDEELYDVLDADSNICGRFSVNQLDRDLSFSFINSLLAKFAIGFVMTSSGLVFSQEIAKETANTEIQSEVEKVSVGNCLPSSVDKTCPAVVRFGTPSVKIDKTKLPLYVVDGRKLRGDAYKKVSLDDIESMRFMGGEKAIKRYGKKAKNGVILISTKKNKNK